MSEEGGEGGRNGVPFVVFLLVGDRHVPVADGPILFKDVLEIWKFGQVVFGCLDGVRVKIGGDVEVRVGVG